MSQPQAVTQSEFARLEGKARSYITALKNAGRLVLTADGKVDVEASRQKIAATSDPNRDDVSKRWSESRKKPEAPTPSDDNKIGNSYQAARAVKEKFAAMTAKMEYERATGKLIEKNAVESAIEDVFSSLRNELERLPARLSADLVGKSLETIRVLLKQEINNALASLYKSWAEQITELADHENK